VVVDWGLRFRAEDDTCREELEQQARGECYLPQPPVHSALAATAADQLALLDDVISSGRSIVAGIELLGLCGTTPLAIGAAMLQGEAWRAARTAALPDWQESDVRGVWNAGAAKDGGRLGGVNRNAGRLEPIGRSVVTGEGSAERRDPGMQNPRGLWAAGVLISIW